MGKVMASSAWYSLLSRGTQKPFSRVPVWHKGCLNIKLDIEIKEISQEKLTFTYKRTQSRQKIISSLRLSSIQSEEVEIQKMFETVLKMFEMVLKF